MQARVQPSQRVTDLVRAGDVFARRHQAHRVEALHDHLVAIHVVLLQLLQARLHSPETLRFRGDAVVCFRPAQQQDPA